MSDDYIIDLGYNDWCAPKEIKACSAEVLNTPYLHKVFELIKTADRLVELIIQRDYHLEMGIFGIKYVFGVLSEYGYGDVLYRVVTNPTYPSYANWINSGMTTLCENWEMRSSRNHHMYSEIGNWFYRYIAGIKISKDELVINPLKLKAVTEVKAYHRGISVEIKGDVLKVEIPSDIKCATVIWNNKKTIVDSGCYEF